MPRSAQFTQEEVINAAVQIVESEGIEKLTARSLGKKLGSSSRPIFTTFKSMEEVFDGVLNFAESLYQTYVRSGLLKPIAFKGVGESYIRFAEEHPKLFRLLFMRERAELPDLKSILGLIEESYSIILNSITENYSVDETFAKDLYFQMWIYSHGIAVLIVDKMCRFNETEISDLLTNAFKSFLIGGRKK